MVEGILILGLAAVAAPVIAACGRGNRAPGPSWFDILLHTPRPTNRAARRGR